MPDSFTHLHVASGWSLKYGASAPEALVALAAEHGMGALALTDRDGAYGAVKFAQACLAAGIAPILGVDLAVAPSGALPASATPAWAADPAQPGPRRGRGRPRPCPGRRARPLRRPGLGRAVPADQRGAPGRRAGPAAGHARSGGRARRRRRPARAARPGQRGGARGGGPPPGSGPGRARPLARRRRPRPVAGRGGLAPRRGRAARHPAPG